MEKRRITKIDELTPVDKYNDIYFKRDDLYLPFDDMPDLGGGKVRQTLYLFKCLKEDGVFEKYDGIITYVSVKSPQAIIVAKVAKEYDIPIHVSFGVNDSTENVIKKHKVINECEKLGASFHNVAKIGYNNVLLAHTKKIAEEKNLYIVHFGINIDDAPEALTGGISDQVQNIPDDLDNLVVPVGSGISLAAILVGLKKYKKNVKRVIGIQISGYDRRKDIDKILKDMDSDDMKYEFYIDKTYPYATHLNMMIRSELDDSGFKDIVIDMNVVYESKAWAYWEKHKRKLSKDAGFKYSKHDKTLYWIVGLNNTLFR